MYAERSAIDGQFYVAETKEIERVRNLPRRDWQASPDTQELIARLTKWLMHTPAKCTPRCMCCEYISSLNAAQAHFLTELYASKGRSVAPFRTGGGKTLPTFVAGTVLEKALGRPLKVVLVIPAGGWSKTTLEYQAYAKHLRVYSLQLVSYETLAHPKHQHWLENAQPDVIICDEAHKLKNPRGKAAGRIRKYIAGRVAAGGDVIFLPFTASYIGRSIMESWHYTRWAMRDRAPVPETEQEACVWASAMDEKVAEEARVLPGALVTLGPSPGDYDKVTKARKLFGLRQVHTPGIVATMDGVAPVTLKFSATELQLPDNVRDMIAHLRKKKELPNGDTFESAMRVCSIARQLSAGMYYYFDPPPPRAWLEARKAWHKFCDVTLQHSRRMDSAVHVANAIDRGELKDGGVLAHWRELRPHYEYKTVDAWIDDTMLKYCANWLSEHKTGLCWVEHIAFGTKLSELTGLPYFSEKARDQKGRLLNTYKGGSAIVSVTQREQHNLQFFDANLITLALPKGDSTDQLIGRTCRDGQGADEVTVEWLLTCEESYRWLAQDFADARASSDLEGGQPKKLCYGECTDELITALRNGDHEYATA